MRRGCYVRRFLLPFSDIRCPHWLCVFLDFFSPCSTSCNWAAWRARIWRFQPILAGTFLRPLPPGGKELLYCVIDTKSESLRGIRRPWLVRNPSSSVRPRMRSTRHLNWQGSGLHLSPVAASSIPFSILQSLQRWLFYCLEGLGAFLNIPKDCAPLVVRSGRISPQSPATKGPLTPSSCRRQTLDGIRR